MNIGFIGTGHMASSILEIIKKSDNNFYIFNRTLEKAGKLKDVNVKVTKVDELIKRCDYIFLGVRPQDLDSLTKYQFNKDKIYISMLAGKNIDLIKKTLKIDKIIRIMPNTPVIVGKGLTFYCSDNVNNKEIELFKSFYFLTGSLYEIEEDKMDVVSVIGGSSPAYLDFFLDSLIVASKKMGLANSEEIILKMAEGTIELIKNSKKSIKELGDEVATPGGSTIEGINYLLDNHLYDLVENACLKSLERNKRF